MRNKSYQDFLQGLRRQDVHPSFSTISTVVATSATGKKGTSAAPMLAGALIVAGAVAIGVWMNVMSPAKMPIESASSRLRSMESVAASRGGEKPSHNIKHIQAGLPTKAEIQVYGLLTQSLNTQSVDLGIRLRGSDNNSIPPFHDTMVQSVGAQSSALDTTELLWPVSNPREEESAHLSASFHTSMVSTLAPNDSDKMSNRFFLTAGGGASQQFSSNVDLRNFTIGDAFLGLGYDLSDHSSVRLLGMEEAFSNTAISYTQSYRDTTFSHGGQTFHNVIGDVVASSSIHSQIIFSLGASYRYSFGEVTSFVRPFAEVLAGGGAGGAVFHESVGMVLFGESKFQVEAALESSELLPSNSLWLTKILVGVAANYHW